MSSSCSLLRSLLLMRQSNAEPSTQGQKALLAVLLMVAAATAVATSAATTAATALLLILGLLIYQDNKVVGAFEKAMASVAFAWRRPFTAWIWCFERMDDAADEVFGDLTRAAEWLSFLICPLALTGVLSIDFVLKTAAVSSVVISLFSFSLRFLGLSSEALIPESPRIHLPMSTSTIAAPEYALMSLVFFAASHIASAVPSTCFFHLPVNTLILFSVDALVIGIIMKKAEPIKQKTTGTVNEFVDMARLLTLPSMAHFLISGRPASTSFALFLLAAALCTAGIRILRLLLPSLIFSRADLPEGFFEPIRAWSLPVIGSFPFIDLAEPQRSFLRLAKKAGRAIFKISMPRPATVIAGLHEMKTIAVDKRSSSRPDTYLYQTFTGNNRRGSGVILSSENVHTRARIYADKFLQSHGVSSDSSIEMLEKHTARMIGVIDGLLAKSNVVDLHRPFSFAVASIIYDMVLGKEFDYHDKEIWALKSMLDNILKMVQSPILLLADSYKWMRGWTSTEKAYRKMGNDLTTFFESQLKEARDQWDSHHRSAHSANTVFSAWLDNPHAFGEEGEKNVLMVAGDVWTGGMETTVTALSWGIIFLMKHPEVQENIYEELKQSVPANAPLSYEQSAARTPYTRAVIEEILRLANVLPWNIPHMAADDMEVTMRDGSRTRIPKGEQIIFAISAVLHDEEYFPKPYQFDPMRHLCESTPEEQEATSSSTRYSFKRHPANIAFGIGQRRCPGQPLARRELYVFLVRLVQTYVFRAIPDTPPSMDRQIGMTSAPKAFSSFITRR